MGSTVRGEFTEFKSDVNLKQDNNTRPVFNGTVKVSSINTGIKLRDKHLRGKSYFNVEEYPEMSFQSDKIIFTNAHSGIIRGTLTIKGIKKEIELEFYQVEKEKNKLWVATTIINRRDFQVGGASLGMGNEVTIEIHIQA